MANTLKHNDPVAKTIGECISRINGSCTKYHVDKVAAKGCSIVNRYCNCLPYSEGSEKCEWSCKCPIAQARNKRVSLIETGIFANLTVEEMKEIRDKYKTVYHSSSNNIDRTTEDRKGVVHSVSELMEHHASKVTSFVIYSKSYNENAKFGAFLMEGDTLGYKRNLAYRILKDAPVQRFYVGFNKLLGKNCLTIALDLYKNQVQELYPDFNI